MLRVCARRWGCVACEGVLRYVVGSSRTWVTICQDTWNNQHGSKDFLRKVLFHPWMTFPNYLGMVNLAILGS